MLSSCKSISITRFLIQHIFIIILNFFQGCCLDFCKYSYLSCVLSAWLDLSLGSPHTDNRTPHPFWQSEWSGQTPSGDDQEDAIGRAWAQVSRIQRHSRHHAKTHLQNASQTHRWRTEQNFVNLFVQMSVWFRSPFAKTLHQTQFYFQSGRDSVLFQLRPHRSGCTPKPGPLGGSVNEVKPVRGSAAKRPLLRMKRLLWD